MWFGLNYTNYDTQCHMVFNVSMVTSWMTLPINTFTNTIRDDGRVHPLAKILPFLVSNL